MLRMYEDVLQVVGELRPLVEAIGRHDADLKKQLRRSASSVVLNVAQGMASLGGRKRVSYEVALGELCESRACLQLAAAWGYIQPLSPELEDRMEKIERTLRRLVSARKRG